jgi:predicted house-cleaning noncanonical NTP pyrophosphatase (MazG superfamily)
MGYHDEERIQKEKEEKRLQGMSVEQLRVELDERLKACLIEEIQAMPERVSKHLDNAAWHIICASLGMKKDTGTTASGRSPTGAQGSPLAKALGEHVLAQIKTAIPDFIEGLVVGDPKIPPIKTAYTKAYKEQLAQLVNNKIWEVAQSNAQKRFREIMEQISNGQKVDPSSVRRRR